MYRILIDNVRQTENVESSVVIAQPNLFWQCIQKLSNWGKSQIKIERINNYKHRCILSTVAKTPNHQYPTVLTKYL